MNGQGSFDDRTRRNAEGMIVGNAAKRYVQREMAALIRSRESTGQSTTIVDMGCGDGRAWDWLEHAFPPGSVRLVGFDLDQAAIRAAQARYPRWRFMAEPAYQIKRAVDSADIVVSFSTLEHVYQRRRFLEAAKTVMTPSSLFFLNYDNGHFFGWREWKRNTFGPILARLGIERYYQAFVWQEEIEGLIRDVGFGVVQELNFHQATMKGFHGVFSAPETVEAHMEAWVTYELQVNALLHKDREAKERADSNRYLLAKLFVLRT